MVSNREEGVEETTVHPIVNDNMEIQRQCMGMPLLALARTAFLPRSVRRFVHG